MKVGVLTSSRADYGIYQPLLNEVKKDSFFNLEIIAFGSHLSELHGYTLHEIEKDKYKSIHAIKVDVFKDDEEGIALSYGATVLEFARFWKNNKFNIVLCLGDRFEMSAAVQAGIPFGVKYAHFHGGETTLGAIDNVYRHQITLASQIHFTATEAYKKKVIELIEKDKNVYSVGSLSLSNINEFKPIEKDAFLSKFNIPMGDFALVTFHPETVLPQKNIQYALEMTDALPKLSEKLNLVITMPNADTLGSLYRKELNELKEKFPNKIFLIENFGKENYFSAMKHAKFLIGNTSSGIIEAASFNKYVVNVGNRQKGRAQSKNIIDSEFSSKSIFFKSIEALNCGDFFGENIYYKNNVTNNIISVLKNSV